MPQKLLRQPRRINKIGKSATRARVLTTKLNDESTPFMGLVRANANKAQILDPFTGFYTGTEDMAILEPRLPFNQLVDVGRRNSALNQCVDAYVVNIESYGFQLEFTGSGKESSPKAIAQKNAALNFLDNVNGEKSLRTIREDSRRDKEYTGNRFFEVGRDLAGRINSLDHVPAITVRRTKKDKTATTYTLPMINAEGKVVAREWRKHFCRFVQIGSTGSKIYFKEFGDPRPIDPKTGKVNGSLAIEDQATEIYADALYSPGEAYGLPRWLGALPSMLGLRESELVNLNFFRENAIPAMAVLISGGALTEESFEKVTELFNAARGKDSMNRVLILEAAADDSVGNADQAPPVPRIDMKPMTSERQSDGLFKDYGQDAKRKIRSSMRLPAIYIGDSEEYTKATAQAGQRIAESQVFYPERSQFDDFVNRWVFPTLGITEWRFKTMGPTTYDPESLGTLVDRLARHGAITPNILIKIANQVLDVQIPTPTGAWIDLPFNYTLAMVQNGSQLEEFEDIFAVMHDAALAAETAAAAAEANADALAAAPAAGTPPSGSANDNTATTVAASNRAMQRKISRELRVIANDIINQINDNHGAGIAA